MILLGQHLRGILLLAAVVLFFQCSNSAKTPELNDVNNDVEKEVEIKSLTKDTIAYDYETYYQLKNYLVKEEIDTSEVQVLDFDCALLVYPNLKQIEELKRLDGEEDFYVGADDSNWYQGLAIEKLDSLKIIQTGTEKKYVKFVGEKESWTLDIRKKDFPAWNLILFKRNKSPEVVPTISLTTDQLRNYFKIHEEVNAASLKK